MIKVLRFVFKFFLSLFFIGVLFFLVLLVSILVRQGQIKPLTQIPDAIIVLGAQVKSDGSLSLQLYDRLDSALQVHRQYPDALIFTCGGQGADEPAPEAYAMRQWLISQGVPQDQIIMDDISVNTKENIENTVNMIKNLNLNIKRVCIVTSDYHLPRALALAKDYGLEAEGIACKTKPLYWIKNYFRETLSWGKYYTQKYLNWPK